MIEGLVIAVLCFLTGWLLGGTSITKTTVSLNLKIFEREGKWYVFEKKHGLMVSGKSREEAVNKAKEALERMIRK